MIHLFKEYFVVEFSLSQRCFHKHTVLQMLEKNQENMMKRRQIDYIPIGVFESNEDADMFILKTKEIINDYTMYTAISGRTIVNY